MGDQKLIMTADTGAERRLKYGVNVAVAVVVSVLIVVIINIIAYKYLVKARWDTTHGRQYSLSPQTRKILAGLEHDYQIVTLIAQSDENYENAVNLIKEYDYRSGKVTVESVNPLTSRSDRFFKNLMERYAGSIEPVRQSVDEAIAAVVEARGRLSQQGPLLDETFKDPNFTDPKQRQTMTQIINVLGRFQQDTKEFEPDIRKQLDGMLPDYNGTLRAVRQTLEQIDGLLEQSAGFFRQWVDQTSTADSVKDRLLQLEEQFKAIRGELASSLELLADAPESEGYDDVRRQLNEANTVVLLGSDEVRVIPMSSMFRRPNPQQMERAQAAGQQVQLSFTGEEQLTGALVGMELKEKPMVIFVAGQQPALGPGGAYGVVAERLRVMNFDVHEWSTQPRQQFGQMMPPQPPPDPEPGQKVVWIVPPRPAPNPQNPQAAMGAGQVAQRVKDGLANGQSALIMFTVNPGAMFGPPDELVGVAEEWGITPKTDRIVFKRQIVANNRSVASPQMQINQWPQDLPVSAAIPGMPAIFLAISPLELDEGRSSENGPWVLAEVRDRDLWAETDTFNQNPLYDEEKAADSFVIAAAAQKDGNRLIAIGDPMWATNQVTDYGVFGAGTASLTGAMFPANAELFVNSVLWLADLEQLIAASARTQDIRRVDEISPGGLTALRWTLPVLMSFVTIAVGVGVWMARRGE